MAPIAPFTNTSSLVISYKDLARKLAAKRAQSMATDGKSGAEFWDDRRGLQKCWTYQEQNLLVNVEWKLSEFGTATFAGEDIPAGTSIRIVHEGEHYVTFKGPEDVEDFLEGKGYWALNGNPVDKEEYEARLRYISDYMVSLDPAIDPHGVDVVYCKFPGNSNNHHAEEYNVQVIAANKDANVLILVALKDIKKGEPLYQNYQLWGKPPTWLKNFALDKDITLLHPNMNDFVERDLPTPQDHAATLLVFSQTEREASSHNLAQVAC